MRNYVLTEVGQHIAQDSGLVGLADKMVQEDEIRSDVLDAVINHHPYNPQPEEFLTSTMNHVNEIDKAAIITAFSVPESSGWRYGQAGTVDGLFAGPEHVPFSEVVDEDRLVLAGLVGLDNVRYRSHCALLARSRYQDYGFDSFVDATAFVGAYLVGRLATQKGDVLSRGLDGMLLSPDGFNHTLKVSGTFDGDLIMLSEKTVTSKEIIAPHNKFVEFSPIVRNTVRGYHSVEPMITLAMFQHAVLEQGVEAGRELMHNLSQVLDKSLDPDGGIAYVMGNFADYGYGDTDYLAGHIELLLSDTEHRKLLSESPTLHSSSYLPQSSTCFEILNNSDGLAFRNRDVAIDEIGQSVEIPYESFGGLFTALLEQANLGLGRTSPMQHIQLVGAIRKVLQQSGQ